MKTLKALATAVLELTCFVLASASHLLALALVLSKRYTAASAVADFSLRAQSWAPQLNSPATLGQVAMWKSAQ